MIATRSLTRPLVIAAIALLVVNDHVLKQAAPGLVTGKLSDVAGLMFFPLLLAAGVEHAGVRRGFAMVVAMTIATGAVFTAIKVWAPAGELYRVALAALQWPVRALRALVAGDALPGGGRVALVADRTDLFALVALAVPIAIARRAAPSSASGHASAGAIA